LKKNRSTRGFSGEKRGRIGGVGGRKIVEKGRGFHAAEKKNFSGRSSSRLVRERKFKALPGERKKYCSFR